MGYRDELRKKLLKCVDELGKDSSQDEKILEGFTKNIFELGEAEMNLDFLILVKLNLPPSNESGGIDEYTRYRIYKEFLNSYEENKENSLDSYKDYLRKLF